MKDFCVWALPNTYLMAIRLGGRLGLGLLICPKVRGVFRWHHGGGQGRPSLLWHVRRHGVGVEAGRVRRESTHTDRPRLPQDWGRRGARRHWLDGEINSQSCACSWPPHPHPTTKQWANALTEDKHYAGPTKSKYSTSMPKFKEQTAKQTNECMPVAVRKACNCSSARVMEWVEHTPDQTSSDFFWKGWTIPCFLYFLSLSDSCPSWPTDRVCLLDACDGKGSVKEWNMVIRYNMENNGNKIHKYTKTLNMVITPSCERLI